MTSYYNEIDKHAAAWLRELIKAGHIADGIVDERDIQDVLPSDLAGFTQCHFFAGIGVWSYALRKAGWPDDRPVWTGSCPCQPFSAAGKGSAFADERHLWPHFHWLISQCRPDVVFGEQVASKDGLDWLDLVQADLEGTDYACGAVDTCAAGFGAPHIRQRLYWVGERLGDPIRARLEGHPRDGYRAGGRPLTARPTASASSADRLANPDGRERHGFTISEGRLSDRSSTRRLESNGQSECGGPSGRMANPDRDGLDQGRGRFSSAGNDGAFGDRPFGRLGDADIKHETSVREFSKGPVSHASRGRNPPGPVNGIWSDADWLFCRDGKWRPVEPGYEQMVDGSASSLGRVCASDIEKIEGEINAWSIRHQADAGEALRGVWGELSAEAICEREAGRFSGVRAPSVLLAFMRQLTVQGWRFADALACSRTRASEIVLRVMRFDAEAARTPLQRELAGQLHGESSNPLRELSSLLAHHAETCWADACREKAGAASFPLAHGAAARVVRLRGYGNAINAVQAKAFIEAFMGYQQQVSA